MEEKKTFYALTASIARATEMTYREYLEHRNIAVPEDMEDYELDVDGFMLDFLYEERVIWCPEDKLDEWYIRGDHENNDDITDFVENMMSPSKESTTLTPSNAVVYTTTLPTGWEEHFVGSMQDPYNRSVEYQDYMAENDAKGKVAQHISFMCKWAANGITKPRVKA